MTVQFGSSVYCFTQAPLQIGDKPHYDQMIRTDVAITDFPESYSLVPSSLISDNPQSRFDRHMAPAEGYITVYDPSGCNPVIKFLRTAIGQEQKVTVIVDDEQLKKTPLKVGSGDHAQTITADNVSLFLNAYLAGAGVHLDTVEVEKEKYKALDLNETRRQLKQDPPRQQWWT